MTHAGRDPTIRPARPQDATAILDITREVAAEDVALAVLPHELDGDGLRDVLRRIAATAGPHPRVLLVAWRGEGIVGWIEAIALGRERTRHRAQLVLMVAREHRRTGVGAALLGAAAAWARGQRVEQLRVAVRERNAAALRLYAACGFTVESTHARALKLAPGCYEDEIVLTRWLAD